MELEKLLVLHLRVENLELHVCVDVVNEPAVNTIVETSIKKKAISVIPSIQYEK